MLAIRAFIALLVLLPFAYPQTAVFPERVPTDADFTVAKDRAQTSLSAALNNSATTFTVVSGSRFGNNMIMTIDSEQIYCTTLAGATFSGCTRGFNSTTAASHSSGATVSSFYTSYHHNRVKEELKAALGELGPGMAYVPPGLRSTAFDFAAQQPGGSLIVGANTITLSPCPLGVSGTPPTGVVHYLYISGGVGTAEAVPVTGGSCTSGASSGTVIVTAANTHSGAWAVTSASDGIQESLNTGPDVFIPPGTYTIQGTVSLPLATSMRCVGGESAVIKPAADNTVMFRNVPDNTNPTQWQISDCTISGRDFETNTVRAFQVTDTHLNGGLVYNTNSSIRFANMTFHNVYRAFYMDQVSNVSITNTRVTDNTTTWIGSTLGMAENRTYSVAIEGYLHNPQDYPLPHIPFTLGSSDALITFAYVLTSHIQGFRTQSAGGTAVGVRFEGLCEDVSLADSSLVATYSGVQLRDVATGEAPNWVKITDSHIDHVEIAAIDISGSANFVKINNNQISNNGGDSEAEGVRVTGDADAVVITNNFFQNFADSASGTPNVVRLAGGSNHKVSGNTFVNFTPPAVGVGVQSPTIRYMITDNMFWTGGGGATTPIVDAVQDRWALITGNRFHEADTAINEHRNVTHTLNRSNPTEEIGNIDGTAGSHITDRHTSGGNNDYDFRITFSGGSASATAGEGNMAMAGNLLNLTALKAFVPPQYAFGDLPAASLSLGAVIVCTGCTASSSPCTTGTAMTIAISNGSAWTCK